MPRPGRPSAGAASRAPPAAARRLGDEASEPGAPGDLSARLRRIDAEIAALGPADIALRRIPAGQRTLQAMLAGSLAASEAILGEAEATLAAEIGDAAAYRAFVAERMAAILVACAFQDLTAQRAALVSDLLALIAHRTARFPAQVGAPEPAAAEPADAGAGRGSRLPRPALPGEGNDQAGIDALLAVSASPG